MNITYHGPQTTETTTQLTVARLIWMTAHSWPVRGWALLCFFLFLDKMLQAPQPGNFPYILVAPTPEQSLAPLNLPQNTQHKSNFVSLFNTLLLKCPTVPHSVSSFLLWAISPTWFKHRCDPDALSWVAVTLLAACFWSTLFPECYATWPIRKWTHKTRTRSTLFLLR